MKYIAILLTVFNRKHETLLCLANLYKQRLPDKVCIKVYLTDDGCTDGTSEAICQTYPDVHIIKGNGTLYWNRGMYKAWETASNERQYDYYIWLNDDTFTYPETISTLLTTSQKKEDKAIIVGPTTNAQHTQPTYGGRLNNGEIPIPNGTLIPVTHFNGNIVLIPRSVYQILGNLDYYFTHSKGDFDYGLRAHQQGINIFQVGSYLGECELHHTLDKWCNPSIPLIQRLKILHRPNGMPPKESFHLEYRHYGLRMAIFHFITIYLRCLFPIFWVKYKKKIVNTADL